MFGGSRLFTLLTLVSGVLGELKYLGVAIAGIDFGCDIDGSCPLSTIIFPLAQYGGGDGKGQMTHFVKDDGMNIFRLPVSWQFLLDNKLGGTLDPSNFGKYDKLMQDCLDTGAYCMLDVHNFARYDGGIIGQGGPSDEIFVDLWHQLAAKYAKDDRVVFGIMNEPHDLDIDIWAQTCQKAVTEIRNTGANSQMILLPGTNFASAETLVSTGSAEALAAIKNPDGSKDNLLIDIHKYLDENNSGSHSECTTNNVAAFQSIATWLKENNRQGMVSESGASMDPSCMVDFCEQNKFINANSDVFLGFVGWGAGSFDASYILSLTPIPDGPGHYTDNKLMKQCIIGEYGKAGLAVSSSSAPSTTGPTSTSSGQSSKQTHSTTSASTQTSTPSGDAVSSADDEGGARSIEPLAGGLVLGAGALFSAWWHLA